MYVMQSEHVMKFVKRGKGYEEECDIEQKMNQSSPYDILVIDHDKLPVSEHNSFFACGNSKQCTYCSIQEMCKVQSVISTANSETIDMEPQSVDEHNNLKTRNEDIDQKNIPTFPLTDHNPQTRNNTGKQA